MSIGCRTGRLASITVSRSLHFIRKRSLVVAGKCTRPFSRSSTPSLNQIRTSRFMTMHNDNRLWNPRSGIRFSPIAKATVTYPQLDVARFLFGSSFGGASSKRPRHDTPTDREDGVDQKESLPKDLSGTPLFDTSRSMASPEQEGKQQPVEGPLINDEPQKSSTPEIEPPVTPLDFNISHEAFYSARKSPRGSPGSFWSHKLYQSTASDGTIEKVKVHYCTSKDTMERVCKTHFIGEKVLGFDLEWMVYAKSTDGPRAFVSVIQLASPSHIAIFHLARFPKDDFVAPSFKRIMEDSTVSKAGVSIKGDCARIKTSLGIETKGIFELSHLYRLVKHSFDGRTELINRKLVALATQVNDYLHLPLYKEESVRSSNWSLPLSERQILYSAADAYAGVQLYHVLEAKRMALVPTPPRPYFAEENRPIRIAEAIVASEAEAEADMDAEELLPVEEIMAAVPVPKAKAGTQPALRIPSVAVESSKKSLPSQTSQPKPKDPRIVAAEVQISNYYRSATTTTAKAKQSSLRAYYIWHGNDNLTPEGVAGVMRDPPLKVNTVVTYILDAITTGGLPYNKARLEGEILRSLPQETLRLPRYERLVLACRGTP
ncbi:hypothetical protein B0I35DRAFT_432286 [Stachybotrys elegans]|uniref:3'-5' exonuclease domain-containing protein n=1 Tax=Stachybotrys elegans TaxID=80388 RepID=A0A8K0SRM0_9HYPO|nr:hypothetical protein B0I35DRAFT_432286 [Stachybotrys elegans]